MKKRSKNILLTLVVALVLVSVLTESARATDSSVLPTSGTITSGHFTLTDDLNLTGTLTISGTVWIDLNGYSIVGSEEKDIFAVGSNGTLNLLDSIGTGSITHSGAAQNRGRGIDVNGGTIYMYGGSITSNSVFEKDGGGVFIDGNGTFYMYGGSINSNISYSGHGGGVYIKNGTLNLYGGMVNGNSAGYTNWTYGGGVYVDTSSKLNMFGGVIKDNNDGSSDKKSYNIKIADGGSFTWHGGTISNSTSSSTSNVSSYTDIGISGTLTDSRSSCYVSNTFPSISNGTAGNPQCLQLINDISLGTALSISGNVVLDLNGYVLKRNIDTSTTGGNIITVTSGATLTLVDSNPSRVHDDNLLPRGGLITGGKNSGMGGGVRVTDSTFYLNGGTIANNISNYASDGGGGVSISGTSTFVMNGGSIEANEATSSSVGGSGGGVYIHSGSFTLNGGSITGNSASRMGGGIYVNGTFEMNGGVIGGSESKKNTAKSGGGGVTIYSSNSVTMTNGKICYNEANSFGGGVYVYSGTFIIENGTISGNIVTGNSSKGGGIFVDSGHGSLRLSGRSCINGNYKKSNSEAVGSENDVYLPSGKNITVLTTITGDSNTIGILMQTAGTFTSGLSTNPASIFFSNDSDYEVTLDNNSEAQLTKKKFTVSFNPNGGSNVEAQSVEIKAKATRPVDPTKAGYTFSAWCSDEALTSDFNFSTSVTNNLTLSAKWTPTSYIITFNTVGGDSISNQNYNIESTEILPSPTKLGYSFDGWKVTSASGNWTADDIIVAGTPLTGKFGNATLTAQWTAAPLTGTISLSGTEKYGQTLTAMYTGGNNTGTLTFQWKRGESASVIGTESTYTLVKADIGNTLTCTVSSSEQTGSLTSSSTSVIGKAASPAAPSLGAEAPTSEGGSDGKITETTSLMEYSSLADFTSATPCSDTETTGLSAGPYYVRIKETSTTEAGIPASVTVPAYESPIVAVTSVTLDHSALTLIIGESGGSLTETISPSNATNKVVTWTSSDEDVVTVANGTLTAVASGIATITITTEDGGFSASCVVTVTSGYPIWVNNVRITTANASNVLGDGTVSYNAASSTLTLNGATITGGRNLPGIRAGIYASGVDLIIHVTGSSTIHPTAQGDVLHSAIYLNSSESTLTITVDSGVTLTTIGPSPQLSHGSSHGIYTSGSIIITGSGTLDARSNYAPEGSTAIHGQNGVVVRSGTVNATGSMDYQGYGLNKLTIEGATASVTAVGYSKAVRLDTINPVQGTGWMTIDGSDAPTSIATNSEGNQLNYKKIQFPASSNALTISSTANGAIAVSANGSAITSGTNIAEGASVTTIATPNAGYHLGGLTYTPAGGEADAITSGSSFSMPDAATVISAAFAPNTYTISFNGNGNTGGSMSAQGFAYNAAQPLTANLFSRAGYNFAGWNTAANGSGITYSDRQSINNLTPENGATIVLYAQWTAQNTPPPTTPTSPTLDSSSSNDYGSSDDSGPYSPPVSQSTDSSNSASNDSVTVENSVSNADGSVSTTSTNRDGSTTTTTIGVDGSKSETTNKTEMTRSSDGSTTATTTETTAKAGDDGSKTESTSTSTTTTSETSDGGRSESTVSAQTTTTTAPDGTSLTTETKTETTIVVDKDGNGTVEGKTTETVKDSSGNITETSVTEIVGTVMTDVEGNKTTTTANTTTTTDAEGNERVTVTEEQVVEKKDGSVGKTVSDEAGNTISAEAVVSPIAVENAARERNPVVIPVSVSKGMDETSAPSVEITLPTLKEGVSISIVIPIAETTPTTVPVRVHSDGTSEIIKTSLSEDDGILLPLEKGETIKIIDNDVPLFDVPDSAWYSSAVDWAVSHGIMSGSGDGTFEPENPTTRGMMAQTIYNFDSIFVEGRNKFQDVTSDDWFYTAVTWATDEGVVVGYEDHTFRPNQDVTREELSLMLYRYADGKAASTDITHFVDSESVSPWASLAVQWAVDEGILRGSDNLLGEPTLAPRAPATRSEIAIMIMRYCETLLR